MSVAHAQGTAPVTLSPCQPITPSSDVPAWLRIWSVLTAVAALPLVTLGAEVTTKGVGMVDSHGFRAPWHLFTLSEDQRYLGYLIEHSHRFAGFVVGFACIVLALGLTLRGSGWRRWLGWLALCAVGLQGVLGIFRVNLHDWLGMGPTLALIHGCFAQLTFATLVAVAVLCSRAWSQPAEMTASLRLPSLGLCLLVYTQIVFGAVLRHLADPIAQRLHVLLAFIVVVCVVLMHLRLRADGSRAARRVGSILAGLIVVQPILGVEAWIRRFGSGEWAEMVHSDFALSLVRSGHQVIGTLVFATTVALALLLWKPAVGAKASGTSARLEAGV